MSRREVRLDEPDRWVFNQMVDAYAARPDYPEPLVDAVAALVRGPRIADIGAGLGHLALPLARRGHAILAIEAASAMRDRLEQRARKASLPITTLHAAAESLPLPEASLDAALIADALHFFDVERSAHELKRTLANDAVVVVITCEMGDTPFMRRLQMVMEESAPRRPRRGDHAIAKLFAITNAVEAPSRTFEDATPVDHMTLMRILASISFIGPAMNEARTTRFEERVRALSDTPIWSRRFTLRCGRVGR